MALNMVTVTVTSQDAGGDATAGAVSVAPTSRVTASGVTVVSQQPVVRQMSGGAVSVQLVATDNAGTDPGAGFWAYSFTLPGWTSPGLYFVDFADGASQRFDSLTQAVPSTTYGPAAGTGGGFTSPMTTLGDTLYEDATPAAARLAGNTTTTRKFLRQQGTGSVSAVPAWDTLQIGDIPGRPWQFRPEAYGALGNGKITADAAITSASHTLTSASAGFASGDVGKVVYIIGAGAAGADLTTTISAFTNSTTVTLTAAAGATVTNAFLLFGTDDTSAVNSAVSAATTYALAHNFYAEILFSPVIYVINGAPVQGGGTLGNAQIPLPVVARTAQKLVLAFKGGADASALPHWLQTTPQFAGAVLACTRLDGTNDGTFGAASVIGGPTPQQGYSTSKTSG